MTRQHYIYSDSTVSVSKLTPSYKTWIAEVSSILDNVIDSPSIYAQ